MLFRRVIIDISDLDSLLGPFANHFGLLLKDVRDRLCRPWPLSVLFLEIVINKSPLLVWLILSTVERTCSSRTSCFMRRRISAYFFFSAGRMISASSLIHSRGFFRLGSGLGSFGGCFESCSLASLPFSFLDCTFSQSVVFLGSSPCPASCWGGLFFMSFFFVTLSVGSGESRSFLFSDLVEVSPWSSAADSPSPSAPLSFASSVSTSPDGLSSV
ncbi:GSCOCG00012409001-RA-CDS [Cotesia congregata]|nr:GSCOCG00012409001-RA-CDS [Cotesia congregata]